MLPFEILLRANLQSLADIREKITQLKEASANYLSEQSILQGRYPDDIGIKEKQDHVSTEIKGSYKMDGRMPSVGSSGVQHSEAPTYECEELISATTCKVCRIVANNTGVPVRPTAHVTSKQGHVRRDKCPLVRDLSIEERVKFLRSHGICRSCLSLKVHTRLHPGDSCAYLQEKKLIHLKCRSDSCLFRKSLCNGHYNEKCIKSPSNLRKDSKEQKSDRMDSDDKSTKWIFIKWRNIPRAWDVILIIFYFMISIVKGRKILSHDMFSKTIVKCVSRKQERLTQESISKEPAKRVDFDPG